MSRSPEPDLSALEADPRVIWVEDVLRFGDTDLNGHVNNAVFAALAESGRVHLFRTQFGESRDPDSYFVIAKLTIEFKAELHYPGRVRTGTWISGLGRTSIQLSQVMVADGGRLAGTADAVCVSMSHAGRRPVRFEDATRLAAERVLRSP